MSRGIKFRAYVKKLKKYFRVVGLHWNSKTGEILGCVVVGNNGKSTIALLPDEFILEQYTGLKDKNGKEIYVGDILETCCGKAEVYFDDELLMYRVKVRHGGTMPLVSKKSKRHFDYEVIGNIHENPELLDSRNQEPKKSKWKVIMDNGTMKGGRKR